MSEVKYLVVPLLTIIISQTIKFIIEGLKNHKFDILRLLDGSGGLPSSHSALVASLSTLIGLNYGFESPLFAICVVFSLVVLYDAMGIRYEAGKQAMIINNMVKDKKYLLKEKLGHKPFEVLWGVILGIGMALIFEIII